MTIELMEQATALRNKIGDIKHSLEKLKTDKEFIHITNGWGAGIAVGLDEDDYETVVALCEYLLTKKLKGAEAEFKDLGEGREPGKRECSYLGFTECRFENFKCSECPVVDLLEPLESEAGDE